MQYWATCELCRQWVCLFCMGNREFCHWGGEGSFSQFLHPILSCQFGGGWTHQLPLIVLEIILSCPQVGSDFFRVWESFWLPQLAFDVSWFTVVRCILVIKKQLVWIGWFWSAQVATETASRLYKSLCCGHTGHRSLWAVGLELTTLAWGVLKGNWKAHVFWANNTCVASAAPAVWGFLLHG